MKSKHMKNNYIQNTYIKKARKNSKHMKIKDKRKFIRSTVICIIFIFLIIMSVIIILNKSKNEEETVETSSDINWPEENSNNKNKEENNKWNLILVNKDNALPENFEVKLKNISNGHQVDERIYQYLQEMLDDASEQGLNPIICSSYRTIETQTKLYNNKVKEYRNKGYNKENAEKEASMWVAIPGTSEHHTGLAVDIVSSNYQTLDEGQEKTKEQKWLMENSYKYGFILRYPTDKSEITGINYEPWHYRYVGVEDATKIKDQGVTLEEYLSNSK